MRIRIEFEEVVNRSVVVNCTDLQVARELWEDGPEHIKTNWLVESEVVSRIIDDDEVGYYREEG